MEPITRSEQYLASIIGEEVELPVPQSRIEHYLNIIAQNGVAPSSAGLINYDPDAAYPDGSIGKEVHTLDGDVSQLKSQIDEVEAGFPQKSASGSIVTIEDGADNVPVVSLEAEINPVQDLHGYDSPWPAGGGKNLLPTHATETINGVKFTTNADGSVTLSGTATANAAFDIGRDVLTLPAGTYAPSARATLQTASVTIYKIVGGSASVVTNSLDPFTLTEATSIFYRIFVANGTAASGTIYPMIESGSTITTYAPYQNICPISGWTGANVFDTGVNVWDEEWEVGGLNSNNGANYNNAQDRIRSKNHIPVKGDTQYFLKSTASFATICFYDSAKAFISSRGTTAADTALTMPTNAAFMRFEASSAYGTSYKHDISINYPSTDHEYHAYTGRTVNFSWETEAGTVYGGSLVLNQDGTADLTVDKAGVALSSLTKNGALVNGTVTASQAYTFSAHSTAVASAATHGAISSSGKETVAYFGSHRSNEALPAGCGDGTFAIATTGSGMCVYDTDKDITSEAFDAKYGDTIVCYPLATPQTYHVENVELVKTLYGLNNIWCDTGDIELTYRCDPATYTAEQIRIMLNAMVAPVEATTTASKAYNVNDFLIMNNVLYKVISPIANGGTITIDTNVSATTVGEQLTAILNS